ncbi:MAG: response regulator, partial [Candidatus Omnitrophica bacterium]|nr:response regulator [Candidatus Omnitrophota bacterium]
MIDKVLIIDDNEQDRRIIIRYLKRNGYENIVTADCGNEGVKMVKEENPDLVVLDTVLPDTIGFDVCKRIREEDGGEKKRIIIMQTGGIDSVDAIRAKEVGVDEYCVKTSDCGPLLEAIEKVKKAKKSEKN